MTSPRHQRNSTEAGFSLVEVIVALALLALMAAMLAGIVNGSRQVFGMLLRNDAANSTGPVQTYLRSVFSQALVVASDAPQARLSGLTGQPGHVVFTTSYAGRGQLEGVYLVDLGLHPSLDGSAGYDLVATRSLARGRSEDGTPLSAATQRTALLTHVAHLSLAYYGRRDLSSEDWLWLDEWPFPDRLPSLVRVDVVFGSRDPRSWHRLQIPLPMAN